MSLDIKNLCIEVRDIGKTIKAYIFVKIAQKNIINGNLI